MTESVTVFISEKLGVPRSHIHLQTTIEADLGMAGFDTMEFFTEYFETFGIENPEDFNPAVYVTPENIDPVGTLLRMLSKKYKEQHRIKEVSVQHLARVAQQRRWIDVT